MVKVRPGKPRIMIVEDEIIIAVDLKVHLSQIGYEICALVNSGENAIEAAGSLSPDLVLMDIVLVGEMDGIEAAEAIRSSYNIPVIFLTSHADEGRLQRAKQTLPFGYVLKPFRTGELRIAIEMALFVSQADRERREALAKLRESEAPAPGHHGPCSGPDIGQGSCRKLHHGQSALRVAPKCIPG